MRRLEWLSAVDAAWFRMEHSQSPADIIALMIFAGPVDEVRLRGLIEGGLMTRRRFRQRVASAPLRLLPPRWEREPGPSLSAHFRRCHLQEPGGDDELTALIDALVNEPLDFRRSPWRIRLIEGHRDGPMLLAQLHHCMGDGFALLELLLSLADEAPARVPTATRDGHRGWPPKTWRAARRITHGVRDLAHLLALPFDPVTRLQGVTSGERRLAWSSAIELARVKRVARAHGATINDLLTAALAGALRAYLSERGEVPRSIRALLPINLRSAGELLDETRNNRFGLLFVDLPVGVADRNQRLSHVKASIKRIRASEEPAVSLAFLHVLGRVPGLVADMIEQIFRRKGSLVVSNVPGPLAPITLAGQRVRDMMFWVPHPTGLACGVSFLSYAGTLRVGVRGDRHVLSAPARIAQLFEAELQAFERTPLS